MLYIHIYTDCTEAHKEQVSLPKSSPNMTQKLPISNQNKHT